MSIKQRITPCLWFDDQAAYSGDFEQSFHVITSSHSTAFRALSPEQIGRGVEAQRREMR